MKHRTKTCTHCGRETHPQPQDYDHDTGYGHCYECLNKDAWYVKSEHQIGSDLLVVFYANRPRVGADLFSDDSDPKVTEVFKDGKLVSHFTTHRTKEHCLTVLKEKRNYD